MSGWGFKIAKPDDMDFDTIERVEHARWLGGEILWDDIVPGTPEELEQERLAREVWEAERVAAMRAWDGGECCGHHESVSRAGYCSAACGGCYADPLGVELARSAWELIDTNQPDDPISPWNRARHWGRMANEIKQVANGKAQRIYSIIDELVGWQDDEQAGARDDVPASDG